MQQLCKDRHFFFIENHGKLGSNRKISSEQDFPQITAIKFLSGEQKNRKQEKNNYASI